MTNQSSTLDGLYSRAQGAVAYVDESYYSPSHGTGRTFYVICATIVQQEARGSLREGLLSLAGGDFWHTTEAARSSSGRDKLRAMIDLLRVSATSVCWITEPLSKSDREGESARAELLRESTKDLIEMHLPASGLIIYERRRTGYQANADVRVFTEMRSKSKIDRAFLIHPESPANEPLLWAPDVVAWSYRQSFLGRDASYFAPLKKQTQVLYLNSKSRLP